MHDLFGYTWLAFLGVWLLLAFGNKRTVQRQSWSSRLLQVALGVIAGLLLADKDLRVGILAARFIPASREIAEFGYALLLVGLAIAFWARFTLGRNWSGTVTLKQDHELIRRGPYAFVRHPIYSGILLGFVGTVLALGEVRGLVALALITLTFRLKSLTEESFMHQRFGPQYSDYKRHVKALIPYVW